MIPNDESICIGCGLCCDGTLHSTAVVEEKDEAAVAAVGFEIVDLNGQRVFRQPCPHFSQGRCGVYSQRPPVCQRYRCTLLKKVDAGEVSKPEAREKIAKAKELVALVRSANGRPVTHRNRADLAETLKARLSGSSEAEQRKIARTLLDIGTLNSFLERWFLKKKPVEPAESAGKP